MPARIVEYFLYNKRGTNMIGRGFNTGFGSQKNDTVKLSRDSFPTLPSGLTDGNTGQVMSYLNKAQKSLNQLVLDGRCHCNYRMARAPEVALLH